jgi:hypothetical protein
MKTISISLSDQQAAKLQVWADQAGVPPEELLRCRVEQFLEPSERSFQDAAQYILKKNEELYRRLA